MIHAGLSMMELGCVMIASKKRRNLVKEDKQTNIAAAMQVLQILVLAIGLAGVFVRLGENQVT